MSRGFKSISSDPGYSMTLSWEKNYDYKLALQMFTDRWYIPFVFAIFLYLPILYIGQIIMKNREPFNLRIPMMLWNAGLAVFSIFGFSRVAPEFFFSLMRNGFEHSICDNSYIHVPQANFWIYLFVLSKIPELGDTLFLVLRKQKLIFLHVYHHATVLIFSWFVYGNSMASARWFCTMNFGVHSIMYTYYVLKAMPNILRIPKWVSMVITTSQTIQMVLGTYAVVSSFLIHLKGGNCATDTKMSIFGAIIYISYLVLFSNFFYKAYCCPRPPKELTTTKKDI